jgi:membrane protease YdiL (CAAX protease family)
MSASQAPVPQRGDPGIRLSLSVMLIWVLFDRLAAATGSYLGQSGLLVGAVVVAAVLAAERVLFGRSPRRAVASLGFGRPAAPGLLAAAVVSLGMLAFFPVFARVTGADPGMRPGWVLLLPGLFAQAGVAEEVLFRGYLFGHLRAGRSFWRAALLSLPPFLAVHLLLFLQMDAAVATAAVLTSLVISFPLARLYDLGGGTIWAPAILHWVVQGAIKLVVFSPDRWLMPASLAWMALSWLLPWLVFAFRPGRANSRGGPVQRGPPAA